jgi:hypothetical protein
MLHEESLEIKNKSIYAVLSELKNSEPNAAVADEVNHLSAIDNERAPFDASEYEKHLDDYPALAYLHLVTPSDE